MMIFLIFFSAKSCQAHVDFLPTEMRNDTSDVDFVPVEMKTDAPSKNVGNDTDVTEGIVEEISTTKSTRRRGRKTDSGK
jgi:hypothetical protein